MQDLLYSFIIEKSYECWNHLTLKSLWLEIISVLQLYQLNFNISLSFEKLQPPNYGFHLTKQFNNFKVDFKNSPSGFVFPFFFLFFTSVTVNCFNLGTECLQLWSCDLSPIVSNHLNYFKEKVCGCLRHDFSSNKKAPKWPPLSWKKWGQNQLDFLMLLG